MACFCYLKGYVLEGLLGNWNDNPDDDLTSNGGTTVSPNASSEVIYNQFAKTCKFAVIFFEIYLAVCVWTLIVLWNIHWNNKFCQILSPGGTHPTFW